MRILFPHKLNAHPAVSTIYRNLAEQLHDRHEIHSVFDCSGEIGGGDRGVNLITLSGSKWRRALAYANAYFDPFDIVHTGPVIHSLMAAGGRALRQNNHIVHTIHSIDQVYWRPDTVAGARQRTMVRLADQVVSVSPFIAEHVEREYGVTSIVVPNGVDLETHQPSKKPTAGHYLFIGHQAGRKHPEFVAELAGSMPNSEFRVGLRDTTTLFDDLPNVTVLGYLESDELAAEYAAATATLCPYENEGFGMVVLESMASGTPVVGLDSGNLPALIADGENGRICSDLDTSEWRQALEAIVDSDLEATTRRSAKPYAWPTIACEYERVYNETATTDSSLQTITQ